MLSDSTADVRLSKLAKYSAEQAMVSHMLNLMNKLCKVGRALLHPVKQWNVQNLAMLLVYRAVYWNSPWCSLCSSL